MYSKEFKIDAGIVNKVCNNFELYILLKYTTMKIHIKQDSNNSLIFNSLFPFYPMLLNKIAQMELKWRIVCPYSLPKRKKIFFLSATLNGMVQNCFKMSYPRIHVCMPKCFKKYIFLSHFELYMWLRRVSVNLIISVNIIMVSPTTLWSIFPFLRNTSLLVIKGMLYYWSWKSQRGKFNVHFIILCQNYMHRRLFNNLCFLI